MLCRKCEQEKSDADFYGCNKTTCKDCVRAAVKSRYVNNRDAINAYERERSRRPERRAKALDYQREMRRRNPEKYLARQKVKRAVESGRLTKPEFCGVCGRVGDVEGHHTDYSRPLDVLWLCFACHRIYGHGQEVAVVG